MTTTRTKDAKDGEATPEYETTPQELRRLLEGAPDRVLVLDIRSPEAYATGHIPGARNAPLETLGAIHAELPRGRLLVTCCGGDACGLSLMAALELTATGFRAKRLRGGVEGWRRKGYAVATATPAHAG